MSVCLRLNLLIGIWLILGLNQTICAQQYRVSGLIKDSLSGDVIPGVLIELIGQNKNGLSDSSGQYYLETAPGRYNIKPVFWVIKVFSEILM